MSLSPHKTLPKPMLIGSGLLLALGLFLAAGDPGKTEREQLAKSLTEAQQQLDGLNQKIATQEAQLRQQHELLMLSTKRLELAEENAARLRTRTDEIERQLSAQRKTVIQPPKLTPVAKPMAKPTTQPTKPALTKH